MLMDQSVADQRLNEKSHQTPGASSPNLAQSYNIVNCASFSGCSYLYAERLLLSKCFEFRFIVKSPAVLVDDFLVAASVGIESDGELLWVLTLGASYSCAAAIRMFKVCMCIFGGTLEGGGAILCNIQYSTTCDHLLSSKFENYKINNNNHIRNCT